MACAASTEPAVPADASDDAFSLERRWRIAPQVAIRPEQFGGLAYHYGTRRLSFLKSRGLLEVVQRLDGCSNAWDACRAAGVPDDELPRYEQALAVLARTGMICEATE